MTIDFDDLAVKAGYTSMRQYVALNYYLPRRFLTLQEMAETLKVSDWAIRSWMKKEDLPRREKGYPRNRQGFYCEECFSLTSLRYITYNSKTGKFYCPKCSKFFKQENQGKEENE